MLVYIEAPILLAIVLLVALANLRDAEGIESKRLTGKNQGRLGNL
jgi:hypothetical protein